MMGQVNIFDRLYEKYDKWYDKNKYAYLSELEAVKKLLPAKGRGLEIGVGTGRFASVLGIKEGIDPSANMLTIAKKRGIKVKQSKGQRLPFDNGIFDYVVLIVTICFVEEPEKVLSEAYRVLKEGGSLILGIVDKDTFLGKYYQEKESSFYKQARLFGVKELTSLLESSGFSNFSYSQTLFDFPENIISVQSPGEGFGQGGFVAIRAENLKKSP